MSLNASPSLIDDLVIANHILVNEGILDGFGHISVRHDRDPSLFLIARSMAPGLVTADDIVACDLEGVVQSERGYKTYVERFIHSEIYRVRSDVMSIIHSHSQSVIPFGVTGTRLRPICHMSGFLGADVPVFEIRHALGDTSDLLIRSQSLGKSLACTLGQSAVALLRGHGNVVVGKNIKQVVFRAVYTEGNARLQIEASRLGDINYLTPGEAQAASDMNDEHLDRPWEVWKKRVT
jgi:HCOMODA/2-hydroxy-3-carboxy-muconic semialdehyde decarboxylase